MWVKRDKVNCQQNRKYALMLVIDMERNMISQRLAFLL
jgi:hypothetical protein